MTAIEKDPVFPPMKFDFIHIKTPQLIGIIAGILVFVVTISVVIYLLYASGSLSKLVEEMKAPPNSTEPATKKESNCSPQFQNIPELYDNLITAMNTLPTKPVIGSLNGEDVVVKPFVVEIDSEVVFKACNGSPQYNESAYDPARLWGWLDSTSLKKEGSESSVSIAESYPSSSKAKLIAKYDDTTSTDAIHLVIVDKELNRQIGMLSLVDNCPKSLSIRFDDIWVTPAYQGKKRAHEAVMLVMQWLVAAGYRRITVELDERHIIGRKFVERCGFSLEAILRKHKIVQNRNRNTALYSILNTDWMEVEVKLKTYLGHSLQPVVQKAAGIELGIKREAMGKENEREISTTSTKGKKNKSKKNK